MPDQRESFEKQQRSRTSRFREFEAGEAEPDLGMMPEPEAKRIEVVSGLLKSHQSSLAMNSLPLAIPLPDLAGAVGELAARIQKSPNSRTYLEKSGETLEPPLINFPESIENERSTHSSVSPDPIAPVGSAPDSRVRTQEIPASRTGSTIETTPGLFPYSGSSKVSQVAEHRLLVPISHPIGTGVATQPAEQVIDRDSESTNDFSLGANFSRIDHGTQVISGSETVSVSGNSALSRLDAQAAPKDSGNSRGLEQAGVKASNQDLEGVAWFGEVEPDSRLVRNPRSSDLRNFSMATSAGPGYGMPSSTNSSPETVPSEPAIGSAPSPSDGGSIDLSKTNELLQLLVDAVRKQRSSSLPVGGPSVYPSR